MDAFDHAFAFHDRLYASSLRASAEHTAGDAKLFIRQVEVLRDMAFALPMAPTHSRRYARMIEERPEIDELIAKARRAAVPGDAFALADAAFAMLHTYLSAYYVEYIETPSAFSGLMRRKARR